MVTAQINTMSSARQRCVSILALVCAFVSVSARAAALPQNVWAEHQIDAMSSEQQVAQLLIVGFDGTVAGHDLKRMIKKWGVGGVVLYKRNIRSASQTRDLTRAIKTLAGHRTMPFVAVDHEGGTVQRLKSGVALLPGNMALGAAGSPALARRAGASVGRGLRNLGFTMNFAPVLDVYSNPASAIGTRSFGDSPAAVGALGVAFIEGQSAQHVLSVAKHFVGEGAAAGDSHEMTPWVRSTAAELEARDVVPFRMAMASGLAAIMTSHAAAPALTEEGGAPMTLSTRVITDLLRTRLGFRGLVITDALEMESVARLHDPGELALEAIDAGADVILAIGTQQDRDAIFARLCEARRTKRLPAARVRASLRRILAAKAGLLDPATATAGPDDATIATEIAEASLTIVAGDAGLANLRAYARRDLFYIGPDETLAARLSIRGASIGTLGMMPDVIRRAKEIAGMAGGAPIIVAAFANPRQAMVVDAVSARLPAARLVAVSLGNPHDAALIHGAAVVVAAYSTTPAAQQSVGRLLQGDLVARGRLPIAMPAASPAGEGRQTPGGLLRAGCASSEENFDVEREERWRE